MAKKKNEVAVREETSKELTAQQQFNGLMLAFNMGVMGIREQAQQHMDNPDILWDCLQDYLKLCAQFGMSIGNLSCYAAIGISKKDASNWRNGNRRASDPRYKKLIDYIDTINSVNRETLLMEGRLQAIPAIWLQKNFDNMTDAPQETPEIGADDTEKTPEQIREQYKYLVTVEAAESPDTGSKKP